MQGECFSIRVNNKEICVLLKLKNSGLCLTWVAGGFQGKGEGEELGSHRNLALDHRSVSNVLFELTVSVTRLKGT